MALLTGDDERGSSTRERSSPSLRRHLRDVVVLAVTVGVAYAVLRYLGSRSNGQAVPDPIADRVEDATSFEDLTDAEPIQIDVPDGDADESGTDSGAAEPGPDDSGSDPETETAAADGASERVSDDETNVDLADDDRSAAEIEERASSDVQDDPAEPGEMTVDDDVADELVDEAEEADDESNDQ